MEYYRFIEKQKKYAKAKWAEILGASTSGYYTWMQERETRQQKREYLGQKILTVFKSGKGTYGVGRICGILRRQGQTASYQVVRQIMDEKGLKSCHCRRRQRSLTDSRKARSDAYKNLTLDLEINGESVCSTGRVARAPHDAQALTDLIPQNAVSRLTVTNPHIKPSFRKNSGIIFIGLIHITA